MSPRPKSALDTESILARDGLHAEGEPVVIEHVDEDEDFGEPEPIEHETGLFGGDVIWEGRNDG